MKCATCLLVLASFMELASPPALAITHLQADRIHLFNPGPCNRPTGPLWITIGTGQPAPGFINVDSPGFDQIGALLTGNMPAEAEARLRAQTAPCGVIASFYENATPVGAWVVAPDKLLQLISILRRNG